MATGLAREPIARGKRVAFGDGTRIIWGPWSDEIFRNNPHIARPGEERIAHELAWVHHYKGHRLYSHLSADGARWEWHMDFRVVPGMMFLSPEERRAADRAGHGFVLVEPNAVWHKSYAPNRDWGVKKYQAVVDRLHRQGVDVVQFDHGRDKLRHVRLVNAPTYRLAVAVMAQARAALLPEGGLAHAAAAVDVPAVVIFGGWAPAQTLGYAMHVNLSSAGEACGSIQPCLHCRRAMDSIAVEEADNGMSWILSGKQAWAG